MIKKAFTLLEMMIVVVLMAIILGLTLYMGWGYLQEVQYKQDRDLLIGALDDVVTLARTSTYYNGQYFDNIDLYLSGDGFTGMISTGDLSPFGLGLPIDSYKLNKSIMIFPLGPMGVRLKPYELSCMIDQGGTGFILQSTVSDGSTCFELVAEVCKFKQVGC